MVKPRGGRRVLAAVCMLFMLLLTACGEQTTAPYALENTMVFLLLRGGAYGLKMESC